MQARQHLRLICTLLLLVALGGSTGCAPPPPPPTNVRADLYAIAFTSIRINQTSTAVALLSDSIETWLDSVSLKGLDATAVMWRRLAIEGNVTGVSRTISRATARGDTAIVDSGAIVFSRRSMRDTTMQFRSVWRREAKTWRIWRDSVWSR